MAVSTLESLVLRGVSVRPDGQNVELRRGASVPAGAPAIRISVQHPSHGYRRNEPDQGVDNHLVGGYAASGAGRPLGRAAVLSRRCPARTAGRAILSGWPAEGGDNPMYAKTLSLMQATTVASTRAGTSGRPDATHATALPAGAAFKTAARQGGKCAVAKADWRKPAGGTLPASTRGKGAK